MPIHKKHIHRALLNVVKTIVVRRGRVIQSRLRGRFNQERRACRVLDPRRQPWIKVLKITAKIIRRVNAVTILRQIEIDRVTVADVQLAGSYNRKSWMVGG